MNDTKRIPSHSTPYTIHNIACRFYRILKSLSHSESLEYDDFVFFFFFFLFHIENFRSVYRIAFSFIQQNKALRSQHHMLTCAPYALRSAIAAQAKTRRNYVRQALFLNLSLVFFTRRHELHVPRTCCFIFHARVLIHSLIHSIACWHIPLFICTVFVRSLSHFDPIRFTVQLSKPPEHFRCFSSLNVLFIEIIASFHIGNSMV